MRHLKTYKIFESLDFNTIENSDISEDVKDILLDAQDMGYTVELNLKTDYTTALRNTIKSHELFIRFYKKEGKLNQTFSTGDIKETNQRLLNYFGNHLIGAYYNDMVSDNCLSSTGKLEDIWRLATNTDGPSGHRFPENLETKGLQMKFIIDKNIEIVKGKILEKEMPDEWFEKNPTNYLLTNKHIKQKPKMSHSDKTVRNWLTDLDYKDITVTKDTKNDPQIRYRCVYINKEYFMNDKRLMEFWIQTNEFNRIHTAFGGQLDPTLRDMGLGYKCYKSVIDRVGWIRSSEYCSNENSRRVWKNLIKDPDYYAFEVKTTEEGKRYNGFIVFKKTMDKSHIKEILKEFTKDGKIKGKVISSGIGNPKSTKPGETYGMFESQDLNDTLDLFIDYIQDDILDKYDISISPPEFETAYVEFGGFRRIAKVVFGNLSIDEGINLDDRLRVMQVNIEKYINQKITIISHTTDPHEKDNWVQVLFLNHPPRFWHKGHEEK